jgi:hypothetical protein
VANKVFTQLYTGITTDIFGFGFNTKLFLSLVNIPFWHFLIYSHPLSIAICLGSGIFSIIGILLVLFIFSVFTGFNVELSIIVILL